MKYVSFDEYVKNKLNITYQIEKPFLLYLLTNKKTMLLKGHHQNPNLVH